MYKIMGSDQKEYGPVDSQAVREWITQGRANAQTLACFEGSPWKPLSTFPEFADALRSAAPPPLAQVSYGSLAAPRPNRMAIAGLTFSILGMCCMPFSLVGVGLSIAGYLQIQKTPNAYSTTKAIAVAGIVVGALGVILHLVAIQTDAFQQMMREMQRR